MLFFVMNVLYTVCSKFLGMRNKIIIGTIITGALGGVVVKAIRYKPAGQRFDSRWCHWNFSVT